MEDVYKRNYCQNCGRPSHCGTAHYEELQNYDEPPSTLKVCDSCRCGNCNNIEEYKDEF
jgi:hypothetical protein